MWLLEPDAHEKLLRAQAAATSAFDTSALRETTARSSVLSVADSLATIKVEGILTKQPDPLVSFFYGANTAYDDIVSAVDAAESNPKVKAIRFDIDSPGGNVDGLFDALAAIEASSKPKSVFARNALSAAYGIAAAAGNITASGPGAMFGSVGTAVSVGVSDDVITITSSNAPEKRPDPRTEEGRASIVRHLDAIDGLFVGAIAQGRGIDADEVRQSYGRGASLVASEAKKRGMIDGIAGDGLRVVTNNQATAKGGSESVMDLEQLQADHPAVYKAAVEVGVQQERDRVVAHLQLGRTGDMKVALKAIEEGSGMTQTTYSAHMAAAMSRLDVQARREDNNVVEEATNGAKAKQEEDEFEQAVLTRLQALVGNGAIENG